MLDKELDALLPTESNTKITKWYCKISNWVRVVIILGLFILIMLAIIFNETSAKLFTTFLEWMKENIWIGSASFVLIYVFCTVVMIPGSILALGAGFVYVDILGTVFGVLFATLIVWISASIGATLSFINGRYLARKWVVSYATKYDKFQIIEEIVKSYGFSVTFWLRLSSITPYNVFNYFMGLTSVRLIDYIFAHLGMIPDTAVYCFIGGSISEIVEIAQTGVVDNIAFITILIITLVISIIGMITISYFAKKKWNKMVKHIKDKKPAYDDETVSEMQTVYSHISSEYMRV
eukprot:471861_1